MTRRIKHAKTALATPSVAYTDWNDWLVDEAGTVIDLDNLAPTGDLIITQNSVAAITSIAAGAVENTLYLKEGLIGLGIATTDHWALMQFFHTGSPTADWNCGGQYVTVHADWAVDANNDAYGLLVDARVQTGTPTGGYPTSDITSVCGKAQNSGANSALDKLFGGSFEARVYGDAVNEVYGGMFQATNISNSATVGKLVGVYADAYTSDPSAGKTLAITELIGAELRTFGKTNAATSTSAITAAYGLYSSLYCQQAASSTSTIVDAYNIYVTHLRPGGIGAATYGAITNYYGVYILNPTEVTSSNKWPLYVVGGISYFGGQVGIGNVAPATSAALDIVSTTGALLVPRMTTDQKNALTPVAGMIVYDATLGKFQGYEGAAWTSLI